jgi:hypothetical protein
MNLNLDRIEYFTALYTRFCGSHFTYQLLPGTDSSCSGLFISPSLTRLVPEIP